MGGKGLPPNRQHCDTKKGDLDFMLNPADKRHHIETRLRYELDGSIRSDNEEIDDQLEEVLNLNLPSLKNSRKAKIDGVREWLSDVKDRRHGPVPRKLLERELNRLTGGDGDSMPYCQVAVWWLERLLARMKE